MKTSERDYRAEGLQCPGCDEHHHCHDHGFSYYATDRRIRYVSRAAAEERKRKWVEVRGFATGGATVRHPDWKRVFRDASQAGGRGVLVAVYTEDRKAVHLGSIWKNRDGSIELQG